MRIVSGIQPSGQLHLGNFFGAIRQFLTYQYQAQEALYFIADLHALTSLRNGAQLDANCLELATDYIALGLDPERAILFRQSDIREIPLLHWILSTVTPMALMERAHSYKDKTARGLSADIGLFTYPVLMTADIILYGATHVPVGKDQKQHLEFARDICTKFNMTYVEDYNPAHPEKHPGIFHQPESIILDDVATVPGIDGEKMSKSYGNTIEIFAPENIIKKRFMAIKTDSTPVEAPKPDDSPVLAFLKLLASPEEYAEHVQSWREGGVGYGTYKKRLVELYHERFDEARKRRDELVKHPEHVKQILAKGAIRARELASPYITAACHAVGIKPFV